MQIANNLLKHYLRDVLFFCGTACGGKTTVSKAFARKHGLYWLDEDTLNAKMDGLAEPAHQSAWCARPQDPQTYFNRPYLQWHQWLADCGREMLPMQLLELIRLSADRPVAADLYNMPPSLAMELTEPGRIVFLVTTPERVVRDYYDRPDHRAIRACIMGLADPRAALDNCNKTLAHGTRAYLDELERTGLFTITRDDASTVADTLSRVEKHFGFA